LVKWLTFQPSQLAHFSTSVDNEPTKANVVRRTAEGKSKKDIIRCLKRYVIREAYRLLQINPETGEIRS